MYPPDQNNPNPGPSTALKVGVGIIIGIVLAGIIALAGAIGYWRGSKGVENQNTPAKVATPSPAASISPTPASSPTPSPSPTPDLSGKYSGPTGEVDITNVTEKSFSFSIGVGSENGSGSIDGKAFFTTPTVAVFSQDIPDKALYNDPESSYYKKKCKLTFRFAGGKVRVSEDEYACNYWHGAQIDFAGTFARAKKK